MKKFNSNKNKKAKAFTVKGAAAVTQVEEAERRPRRLPAMQALLKTQATAL